jgi:type 1 glutamine amidotransferase
MRRSLHAGVSLPTSLKALALLPLWLGCGGSDDGADPREPPFMAPGAGGAAPVASASGGTGGTGPVRVQGEPEQSPSIPRGAGGSNMVPASNDVGAGPAAEQDPEPSTPALERILVFSRTLGYRHDAIGPGIEALRSLGAANGFEADATEDPSDFNDENLAGFDVVVFLSTTADVLDDGQQAAFERYIRAGGGWVGVHAAADTEYDWPWYGQLLGGGAYFKSHPEIQTVQLEVENATHSATAHLPPSFSLEDEWYNFQQNPRPAVSVLMTLDESSYSPGADAMGEDHPIAWFHEFDGGRAFYTALGHRSELYADPLFTQHLLGGIRWAAGVAP